MKNTIVREYLDGSFTPWSASAEQYVPPPENFILNVLRDGTRNHFHHDVWYPARSVAIIKRKALNIKFKGEPETTLARQNISQSKSIILAIDRHAHVNGDKPLSIDSLNRYNLALQKTRLYAYEQGISVFDSLSSSDHVSNIIKHPECRKSNAEALRDLLPKLSILPLKYIGFVPAKIKFDAEIKDFLDSSPSSQTAVIPTRIYLALLSNYKKMVIDYLVHSDQLVSLARKLCLDQRYGRKKESNNSHAFIDAINAEGLCDYAERHNITEPRSVIRHFSIMQYCSAMLIYAFAGMRKSELYSLRLKSLISKTRNGIIKARGLSGFTTKLHGHKKLAVWYTSVDIEQPFLAASKICKTILECNSIPIQNNWLFISTSYLSFSGHTLDLSKIDTDDAVSGNLEPTRYQSALPTPSITDVDINEARRVDPFRPWLIDTNFTVGSPWPVGIHQIRRSTAVYAIRSGIVTLPALKSMLKHISIEMSKYYSRGSSYAPDILKRHEHQSDPIVSIYQESELYASAWQYVNELVVPDEIIYGPHGSWLEKNSKPHLKKLGYAETLAKTLERMRKGQLSYRPTPVGGCTANGHCTKRIAINFLGCDGCASAAIRPIKLIKLITLQEKTVEQLEANTVERSAEEHTLYELKDLAQRIGIHA